MTNNELLRLEADIFNWCHGFEYDHERLLKLAEQAIQEKIEIMFDDNFFDEKVFFKSHDVFSKVFLQDFQFEQTANLD